MKNPSARDSVESNGLALGRSNNI